MECSGSGAMRYFSGPDSPDVAGLIDNHVWQSCQGVVDKMPAIDVESYYRRVWDGFDGL